MLFVLSFAHICRRLYSLLRTCVQADEGPDEEDGQPETQGAAGEEPERPADGGRQEKRGQPQRELPADKGKGFCVCVYVGRWIGGGGKE